MQKKRWFTQTELAEEMGMTAQWLGKHLIKAGFKDLFRPQFPTHKAFEKNIVRCYAFVNSQGIRCYKIRWHYNVLVLLGLLKSDVVEPRQLLLNFGG